MELRDHQDIFFRFTPVHPTPNTVSDQPSNLSEYLYDERMAAQDRGEVACSCYPVTLRIISLLLHPLEMVL